MATAKTGFRKGSKLGIRTTGSYYDPCPECEESGYDIIGQGNGSDSKSYLERLQDWWQRTTFWDSMFVGAALTTLALAVISLIAWGIDAATGMDDESGSVYTSIVSRVPDGCLGAPFILIDFHGGQSESPLKHGRYNDILKYTRDGCFLGQANQAANTRLRGMRVWGDRLYVVQEGQPTFGRPGNVLRFGGCGKSSNMIQRPLMDAQVLNDPSARCMHHMFGLESLDQGKTLFLSDQNSGTVTHYDATTGKPIQTAGAPTSCPGLLAKWINTSTGDPGLGMRGMCRSEDILFMPYKFIQGVLSVVPGGGQDLSRAVARQQHPGQPGVTNLTKSGTHATRIDLYNITSKSLAKIGGASGWFTGLDKDLQTSHPSACTVHGNKLYFNIRRDSEDVDNGALNGAIGYDLSDKSSILYTQQGMGLTQDMKVHGGTLYIVARDSDGRNLGGNIFRFDLNGTYLDSIITNTGKSQPFPDQPIQMAFSEC